MSRLVRSVVLSAMIGAMSAGAPAQAALITYSEGADLSGVSTAPTALGTLDIGTNVVIGGIACSSGCTGGDLHDYFNVVLPVGQQITSITVALSNFNQSNGAIGHVDTNGLAVSPVTFSLNINNGNTPGTVSLFSGAAIGPGTQGFHLGVGGGGSTDRSLTLDYQVNIVVTAAPASEIDPLAIPEPTTWAFWGFGLLGLTLLHRRRAR